MEFTSDHSNYDQCELTSRNKMKKSDLDQVKIDEFSQKYALNPRQRRHLTRRNREVLDFTWSHVKNNSKLTNLMKIIRIEGYNDK